MFILYISIFLVFFILCTPIFLQAHELACRKIDYMILYKDKYIRHINYYVKVNYV